MKKCNGLVLATVVLVIGYANSARAAAVEFKGWHYPAAKSCEAAKAEFEAKYKSYGYLIGQCRKQNAKAQLGKVESFSCFMGNGKNGFSSGAVITASVACDVPCVTPPTACPAGKKKVGMFISPTGAGWGTGTFAVCLESQQKVTQAWCNAAYFPQSDHKCDDYKGYSTNTVINGKSYCVYNRTSSTYYKALEMAPK